MAVSIVAVLGAGTMGHGIAGQAARCGFTVRLFDIDATAVDRGLASIQKVYAKGVSKGKVTEDEVTAANGRLSGATDLQAAVADADLVIEAAPEDMALKQRIFTDLERLAPAHAIFGTNTSSLPITEIANAIATPERVIGTHFFNPVAVMPLLELVRGEYTSDETVETVRTVGERLLKTCIVVADSPGFATSRLGIILGNEAMRMFEEGVASAEDIDRAMVLGYRHPIGPLALTDLVGLDVRLAISEHLFRELGSDAFRPPKILRRMVRAGKLGKKSGRGFYSY